MLVSAFSQAELSTQQTGLESSPDLEMANVVKLIKLSLLCWRQLGRCKGERKGVSEKYE